MALSQITGTVYTAWMSLRPGIGKTINTNLMYNCLPTDLQIDDYLIGSRMLVTGTPTTASGSTTVPVRRSSGITGTIVIKSTSTLAIVR